METEEKTYLSEAIELASEKDRYDTCVKELLSDKQVLAWIMKYSLKEFENDSIEDIIGYISEPEISSVPLNHTPKKQTKVQRTTEEDKKHREGEVYFDIRFSALHFKNRLKILLNVEAQNSTKPRDLHYHIENRIIYYLARMIVGQKNTEFTKSRYDDLKAVRSIWICMDGRAKESPIVYYDLLRHYTIGEKSESQILDKVEAVVIKLRLRKDVPKASNRLVAMLEVLLGADTPEEKKRKLETDYSLVMTERIEGGIQRMCNLSDMILEKGLKMGREEGRAEGREEGRAEGIKKGMEKGMEKGIKKGIKKGIEKGKAEGREETLITTIRNLMSSMRMDIKQVMDIMQIPLSEQEKYQKLIQ